MAMKYLIPILLWSVTIPGQIHAQAFRHPGIYQSSEDFAELKRRITARQSPWIEAFQRLKKVADTGFIIRPAAHVMRGPYGKPNIGGEDLRKGAEMAYHCALVWNITGEKKFAEKSISILNAWSATLQDFDFNDAKLIAGLTGHVFCNAAEILRHSPSGWKPADQDAFTRMLRTAFYPVLRYYYPQANGNWNGAIIQSLLAIAIFTDDRSLFDESIDNFLHSPFNGSLFKYFYPSGQCQETTRDQGHVQLGIGQFAGAAQIAYTQGIDLFRIADARMALGFEYSASVLMGQRPHAYGIISERAMELRDDFEYVYRHYEAMGISMPWTKMCADSIRSRAHRSILTAIRKWQRPAMEYPKPGISRIGYPTGAQSAPANPLPASMLTVEPGASVQAAVDEAVSSGRAVLLKKGVHKLTETLRLKSGLTMLGEGLGTILFLDPSSASRDLMSNQGDSLHDVLISDLVLECSNRTEVPSDPNSNRSFRGGWNRGGIVIRTETKGSIRNIALQHITVRNATYHGVFINGAENLSIKHCDFNENGGSVVPGPRLQHNLLISHSRGIEISDCRLTTSPAGAGLSLDHCQDLNMSACEISRNAWDGILIAESRNLRFSGNLIEANDRHGLNAEWLHDGSTGLTVTGNRIQYNAGHGIHASAVKAWFASDNKMEGNGKSGINVLPVPIRQGQKD
jgi:Right handed beta helix region/Alginate lyase